ncbi:tRNA (cytosine(34)-C(5))-methyltransferase, mitochondrial isoform X2 [Engraulis encrasicolus]|uniref:tRNA (cytosine(34)-C(5))-methyltransferase, mitochondrial isoform X2 n=1 Tax=Engraulis encrasicolus TaxID=184585 RepID=UPI002FD1FD80
MSGIRSSLSSILFKRVGLRSALLTPRKESSTCLSDPREISQDEPQENGIDHKLKSPRRKVCQPVLDHFDAQYTAELGSLWTSVRSVLLNPGCWQYGVMMNRFADVQELRTRLLELGYCSLLPQRHTTPPYVPPSHSPHGGSLECYVQRGPVRLPAPRHEPGYLKRYFLLNAASLLPVLALGVAENERVLDMCSAPGGKAVAILQTTCPGFLHCNEVDRHRCDWLSKTLESYVPADVMKTLRVTNQDGRDFGQTHQAAYDKVLVDAPCSNDRSWLFSPSELRGHQWLKERQKLPALQTQLLRPSKVVVARLTAGKLYRFLHGGGARRRDEETSTSGGGKVTYWDAPIIYTPAILTTITYSTTFTRCILLGISMSYFI